MKAMKTTAETITGTGMPTQAADPIEDHPFGKPTMMASGVTRYAAPTTAKSVPSVAIIGLT